MVIDNVLGALDVLANGHAFLLMAVGVAAGLIAGAIPGFTIAMAVVLTLPFTFNMPPHLGLATMVSVLVGGLSGGLMAGILTGIPGTPSSVATTFDGFPMARNGEPGLALGIGVWSSFCGGIISADASDALRRLVAATGIPVTSTIMGVGAFPETHELSLRWLGMHGSAYANWAVSGEFEKDAEGNSQKVAEGADLLLAFGVRFDDRVTGKVEKFCEHGTIVHIDIDPSSINKNVHVEVPIVGDVAHVLEDMIKIWKSEQAKPDQKALKGWWKQIDEWRAKDCLKYTQKGDVIKPQYAIQRLYEATRNLDDVFITTEVGQHQMWAAQFYGFEEPNRWMTSGGLGTMGYGLPSAMGVQVAHPDALVIDIAGEASVIMNIQEMSTIAQYRLPVKIFILNNEYMGMVRQWQELLHGGRYAESYMDSLPDFEMLAESFGAVGMRADKAGDLDGMIHEMLKTDKAVIADIRVEKLENCYPMIPSGAAHNNMLLGPEDEADKPISEDGMVLV